MKKAQNRFSIVNSYKKEQSIELLGKLAVEQLLTIINVNNKDILLNIINNSMSRSELQELLFKSSISDESLLNYLHVTVQYDGQGETVRIRVNSARKKAKRTEVRRNEKCAILGGKVPRFRCGSNPRWRRFLVLSPVCPSLLRV